MGRPKGFEPYTDMWKITFEGLYNFNAIFQQVIDATIFTRTEQEADGWVDYFNGLRVVKPGEKVDSKFTWLHVKKESLKWYNRADEVIGQLNGIVPTIFCGVSGFSIG